MEAVRVAPSQSIITKITKVVIRAMTLDDYDKVYALWRNMTVIGLNNLDGSRNGFARYLARNQHTCFVAELGDNILGAILSGHDGRKGFIHHVAVAQTEQRRGIGQALVDTAVTALDNEGIGKVGVVIFSKNKKGNAFWEELEFAERTDLTYREKDTIASEYL